MRHMPNYCIPYSEQKSCSELTRLEQQFGSYVEKTYLAAILENGGLRDSATPGECPP